MQTGQRVIAPLGPATIAAKAGNGNFQVLYSKKNFTPEEWKKISPGNGQFIFRMYSEDELTEVK